MMSGSDPVVLADDDLEFAREQQEQGMPGDGLIPGPLPDGRRPRGRLARLAAESRLAPKQADDFRTAVELDLLRPAEERLGLEALFRACCRHGDRTWLSPSVPLKKLDDILGKFMCRGIDRSGVLSPFVMHLSELAGRGINPAAFLEYIVVPRISGDNDWRRWNERHLEAIEIVGSLLVSMKNGAPFDRAELGNGPVKLVRDIVLVKYVGKPLAMYPLSDLRDRDLLDRYLCAWRRLRIDNAFTILFMKTNILHFMYAMSGRIDLVQLVMIMENMPEIEAGFRENFPGSCFDLDVSRIDMNLYDYDMSREIYDRRMKGFSNYDFAAEIRAYLSIILALLGTGSGIFLCGYFARRLSAAKDPSVAGCIERLIRTIRDDGGRHVYIWHVRRLLSLPVHARDLYIQRVGECGGRDPEYPDPVIYFRGSGMSACDIRSFEQSMKILGISRDDFPPGSLSADKTDTRRIEIPHHAWIAAWLNRYPERQAQVDRFAGELSSGEDRLWNEDRIGEIDGMGIPLHLPLLHMVIPGLGGGFSGAKSLSFRDLHARYGSVRLDEKVMLSRDFRIPVRDMVSFDRFRDAEIRRRINMSLVRKVWRYVEESAPADSRNVTYYINAEYLKIRKSREEKAERYTELSARLNVSSGGMTVDAAEKEISRLQKAVSRMTDRGREFENILAGIPSMGEEERIVTAIVVAGKEAEPGDDFALYTVNLLTARYLNDPTLTARMNSLREDVAVDLVTLKQIEMIAETIDGLARLVAADEVIEKTLNRESSARGGIGELLAPFIATRKKKLTMEALDAAVRGILCFAKLTSELARWHELEEALDGSDNRYLEPHSLYTSRAMTDAYYGDMGSICLAAMPGAITDPAMHVLRLASRAESRIRGIALMYRSDGGLASYMKERVPFWHAFAFNPLPSFLHRLTRRQQLYLYLNYRALVEDVSRETGLPAVLSGIYSWGIISNDGSFAELILAFEKRFGAFHVDDATGLSLMYGEDGYREALVIVDPRRPETFRADELLRSFDWHESAENGRII